MISDDSREEGQLSQEAGRATGTDATVETQIHMQELTQLRDELVRLNEETRAQKASDNGTTTRSYIYVPREC